MGRLIWFSQILCLSFMLLQFRVQSSSPSQSSPDLPPHLCRPEERSALLEFKSTTNLAEDCFGIPRPSPRPITQTWNESIDCCLWEGITCDKMKGHVIGLDLGENCIQANLTTNSSLFRLEKLQNLSLADNYFHYSSISFGFYHWKSLTYLNLTHHSENMDGSLLLEISLLEKLVSLDLSDNYDLHLDSTTFQMLVHNLTELRFLILDHVNMSLVVPSSLQNLTSSLEHLSLGDCSLRGNFSSQVFQLPSLQLLDLSNNYHLGGNLLESNLTELKFLILDYVNIPLVVLSSLPNLTSSLEHLSLSNCRLQGNFPSQVFHLPSLQHLDLSYNYDLEGNLPESNWSSPLKYLSLENTRSFSGELPHSIGNLKLLENLDLYGCKFYGSIPISLANLTEITHLDFSSNLLQGQIPDVFEKMHKLTYLGLYANNLGGEIPASIFNLTHLTSLWLSSNKLTGPLPHNISGLSSLHEFYMDNNFVTGRVPSWLFSLPSLYQLDLRNNTLTGPIDYFEMPNLILQEVDLSNNEISGPIPSSFFDLVNLTKVDLSSNNLSGTITPNMLSKLVDLEDLDLSNNSLLSLNNNDTSANYSFPSLQSLRLSSCNIHKFPSFLRKAKHLELLDISKNKISGQIHKWEIEGMSSLSSLNLSYNSLTSIDLFGLGHLAIVDLRSNLLQGSLPILSTNWKLMQHLFISGNKLTGEIPSLYCKLTSLLILDLANNSLGGKIPECLGNLSDLRILDLQMNKFHGRIPNSFVNGSELRTFKLNGNQLEGILPRSLGYCSFLEIIDLGNNYLEETFPHWLGVLPRLQVLILRSNRFHGAISNSMPASYFPQLRIIDVSQNDFMGPLPSNYIKILIGMRDIARAEKVKLEYIGDNEQYIGDRAFIQCSLRDSCRQGDVDSHFYVNSHFYYEDSVKVVMKGLEVKLARILKIFTTIDFSSNQFHGPIPEEIGELNSLLLLNLSHNSLTGQIPSSLGKMAELESLDLSSNKLEGRIPEQLTNLTFLSVLNLSHNKLEGGIPQGKQFNTFSNDSYIGNSRLCGLPLTKKCHNEEEPGAPPSKFDEEDDLAALFEWKFALAGYGCGLVFELSLGYIAFTIGKPWWVVKKVEKYQEKFVERFNSKYKRRKTHKPNQRS